MGPLFKQGKKLSMQISPVCSVVSNSFPPNAVQSSRDGMSVRVLIQTPKRENQLYTPSSSPHTYKNGPCFNRTASVQFAPIACTNRQQRCRPSLKLAVLNRRRGRRRDIPIENVNSGRVARKKSRVMVRGGRLMRETDGRSVPFFSSRVYVSSFRNLR